MLRHTCFGLAFALGCVATLAGCDAPQQKADASAVTAPQSTQSVAHAPLSAEETAYIDSVLAVIGKLGKAEHDRRDAFKELYADQGLLFDEDWRARLNRALGGMEIYGGALEKSPSAPGRLQQAGHSIRAAGRAYAKAADMMERSFKRMDATMRAALESGVVTPDPTTGGLANAYPVLDQANADLGDALAQIKAARGD